MIKKRLLIITPYGFNERMANFIELIIARMLVKLGWQVATLVRSETTYSRSENLNGILVHRYRSELAGLWNVLRLFFVFRPRIIHIFASRNNRPAIFASAVARLFKIPIVFTEYGLLHDHYLVTDRDNPLPFSQKLKTPGPIFSFKEIFRNKKLTRNLKNYLFHLPLSLSQKIVFVSRHNLEIAELLGLKNTLYLPYIFDNKRWSSFAAKTGVEQSGETELLPEQSENTNFLLFIGQLKLRKGWDVMLEALSLINPALNAKLIFITPSASEEPPEFSFEAKRFEIQNKIIFIGRAETQTLKRAYEICKAVIVPSRYEGFGLAVIEAWEAGKPVVASNVEAINEHVVDGKNGLLVPPGNPEMLAHAIEKVIRDKNLSEALALGGAETLKRFKSEEAKKRWLDFYSGLLKE